MTVDLVKLEELAKRLKALSVDAYSQASRDWDEQDDVPPILRVLGDTFSETAAALTSAKAEIEKLRGALRPMTALVDKMSEVHDSPEYQSVWTLNQLRNGPYQGPSYATQFEEARRAAAAIGEKEPRT